MTKSEKQKLINLLGAGLDSELAAKVVQLGFSLTTVKNSSKSDLSAHFESDEVQQLRSLRRNQIPVDVIRMLVEKSHWKCCICEDYSTTQPVVVHHIEEHSNTQDDSYDNLVVICLNHHAEAHSKWAISRHPLPAELIRLKKQQWEVAVEEYGLGLRPLPDFGTRSPYSVRTDISDEWLEYLEKTQATFQKWHIPSEISFLEELSIEPIDIEGYLRLKPIDSKLFRFDRNNESTSSTTLESANIHEALKTQSMSIIGGAGSGKSTLIRYLAHLYSNSSLKLISQNPNVRGFHVPVVLSLKQYGPSSISSLIYAQLRRNGMKIQREQLDSVLDDVSPIFLLDGFDEIKPKWRDDFISELLTLRESYPENVLILTGRKHPDPDLLIPLKTYQIESLSNEAVLKFIESQLGHNQRYRFMCFVEQRQLEGLTDTPLLLIFCMILFRENHESLMGPAGVFAGVIDIYKTQWEARKKGQRSDVPLDWMVLERALCYLAYRLVVDGLGYALDRSNVLEILQAQVEELRSNNLWSNAHSTFDLLEQLLAHNFLVCDGYQVNFWHATFRDYFAALFISGLSPDEYIAIAQNSENNYVISLLADLLENPKPLVDFLVESVLETEHFLIASRALDILANMGNRFTLDIVRAISKPSFAEIHFTAQRILNERNFEGKIVCLLALNELTTIDYIYMGELSPDSLGDTFPDPDKIDFHAFRPLYTATIEAVVEEDIGKAKQQYDLLRKYLENILLEETEFDRWLVSRGLDDYDLFVKDFKSGEIDLSEFHLFCRNTTYLTSLPFLEFVYFHSDDADLLREAGRAIQCILRR